PPCRSVAIPRAEAAPMQEGDRMGNQGRRQCGREIGWDRRRRRCGMKTGRGVLAAAGADA
uniref:Uncharacterized protein n=1 Tax=Setaria italica TaxID=4555 RepID=A0A341IS73_SETIT